MADTITPEQASNAAPTNPGHDEPGLPPLDVSKAGLDAIDADLRNIGREPAEAQTETPAVKAETEPAAAAEKTEEPTSEQVSETKAETATEKPAEEKPDKTLPLRISTGQFNEIEQEAIRLGKDLKDAGEEVPSLKDRIELVERRRAEAAKAAEPEPEVEPQPRESETLAAKLNEVNDKLAAAAEAETPMTSEMMSLIKEQSELTAQLALATDREAKQEARTAETVQETRKVARAEAIELYPTAGEDGSRLANRISAVIKAAKNPGHPNHSMLLAADAPLLVAHEAARQEAKAIANEKKIPFAEAMASLMAAPKPATPATDTPAPQKTQEPTTKKIQPAGATATTTPPAEPAPTLGDPAKYDLKAEEDYFRQRSTRRSRYVIGY